MQRKKINKRLSTTPLPGTNIVQSNDGTTNGRVDMLIAQPLDQFKIYTSLATIPLLRLEDAMCDGDMSALIVDPDIRELFTTGRITRDDLLPWLQFSWVPIYSDFVDLSDGIDNRYIKQLMTRIAIAKARLLKVRSMVNYLALKLQLIKRVNELGLQGEFEYVNEGDADYDDYIDRLRKLNFRYKYDIKNPKQYGIDLKMIISRTKQWEMDLMLWEKELKAYEDKNAGDKPARVYFTESSMRIGKWYGGTVLENEVTGLQYCILKKQYLEYCDSVKKQNAKRR